MDEHSSWRLPNLPEWVWRLLEALDEYEDEHPRLFREADDGTFERTDCPMGAGVLKHIPPEVQTAVDAMRARRYGLPAEEATDG